MNKRLFFSAQNKKQAQIARSTQYRDYYCDLYVCYLNENMLTQETFGNTTFSNEYPNWIGPDTLIFSSNRNGNYDLYILNLETKKTVRLTDTPEVDEREVTVSPD
ncbi:hypothetical protein DRP07_07180 [Archaeoglobales archaeon]|nr:MAG: hypothetical protein DRP07_07180 [Archaeoglobales archaeon]